MAVTEKAVPIGGKKSFTIPQINLQAGGADNTALSVPAGTDVDICRMCAE